MGAGVGLFAFLFYQTGLTADVIWRTLQGVDPLLVCLVPVISVCFFLFSSLKWRAVTHAQTSERLGLFFYFRYISLSASLGQVLPLTLTGAAIRAFAMKRRDVMPPMQTTGLFIWDQGFDFLSLFIFMLAGVAHFLFGLGGWQAAAGLAVCAGLIHLAMPLFIRFIVWLAGVFGRLSLLPRGIRHRFIALQGAGILDPGLARSLFLLGMGKFLTGAVLYTMIVLSLGQQGMSGLVFWGTPSAEMAGVLSQMPGGLGAFDWTWVGIFSKHGLDKQGAATLAVGLRCLLVMTNFFVTFCVLCVYSVVRHSRR
jgi:uncharacterized membrane protein YbhN (UPF0104 family)